MTRKVLEGVVPWQGWGQVPTGFMPMLQAAGLDITFPRLAAIFGHPFTFSMKKGGGEVWQLANIEWSLMFQQLDLLPCELESFHAVLKGSEPAPDATTLSALKGSAWRAVQASIDRGVPAIAWNAMTVEQRDRGVNGYGWNLLVGYDDAEKSYVVRNQFADEAFDVPFDGFGYTDDVQWYCIMVPGKPNEHAEQELPRRCFRQAVDYAKGTRFDIAQAAYPVDAIGFAAYALWRDALATGEADAVQAEMHASFLKWSREQAAAFLREAGRTSIADAYDVEVASLGKLHAVCAHERDAGRFEASARWEAIRHLDEALSADRRAVAALESILSISA